MMEPSRAEQSRAEYSKETEQSKELGKAKQSKAIAAECQVDGQQQKQQHLLQSWLVPHTKSASFVIHHRHLTWYTQCITRVYAREHVYFQQILCWFFFPLVKVNKWSSPRSENERKSTYARTSKRTKQKTSIALFKRALITKYLKKISKSRYLFIFCCCCCCLYSTRHRVGCDRLWILDIFFLISEFYSSFACFFYQYYLNVFFSCEVWCRLFTFTSE